MATDAITLAAGAPWGSVHNTLSSTTADAITVTGISEPFRIEVVNRSTTQPLWVRVTTTAVASADGTAYIPPAASSGPPSTWTWKVGEGTYSGTGVTVVSVVGNANDYSVHAVPQSAW